MRDKIYMAKSWYQTFFPFTMSKQDRLYFFRVTLSKNIFPYARLIIKTNVIISAYVRYEQIKMLYDENCYIVLLILYDACSSSRPFWLYLTDII